MHATVAAGATGNGRKTPLGQELERIWKGFGKGFDTRFKHARLTAPRGRRIIEDACGEYRRPLSFQLGLFGQPPLKVYGERLDLKAKILEKSIQKA